MSLQRSGILLVAYHLMKRFVPGAASLCNIVLW